MNTATLVERRAVLTTDSKNPESASAILPEFTILGIEAGCRQEDRDRLLCDLVEEHHRLMGFGPVSNVLKSFLEAELDQAA